MLTWASARRLMGTGGHGQRDAPRLRGDRDLRQGGGLVGVAASVYRSCARRSPRTAPTLSSTSRRARTSRPAAACSGWTGRRSVAASATRRRRRRSRRCAGRWRRRDRLAGLIGYTGPTMDQAELPRGTRADVDVRAAGGEHREGGGEGRRGRAGGRRGRLPARAVPHAVLLPEGGPRELRSRRADPGPEHRGARARGEAERCRRRGAALRAARGGRLPQHGGRPRRRRHDRGPLPQDAHPRRSALLREVLLHARATSASTRSTSGRTHRHAGLLGSVVSRGARA